MLGVSAESLNAYGAVSEQVAREMTAGALRASRADVVVGIGGVARDGDPERGAGAPLVAGSLDVGEVGRDRVEPALVRPDRRHSAV